MSPRRSDGQLTETEVRDVLRDPRNWVAAKFLRAHADRRPDGHYERHSHDDLILELEASAPSGDANCVDLLGYYSLIHEGLIYAMAIGTRELALRLPRRPEHLEHPGETVFRYPRFPEHPDPPPVREVEEVGGDWVLVNPWRVIGERSRTHALKTACLDSYRYVAELDGYAEPS
ncbi:MAG TPA: hypothetical protein VMK12_25515 [Anaeromyxobacteraceae bacterium]|nr:hypothetical protein [Anaeromyxobacteraceae bacterium]